MPGRDGGERVLAKVPRNWGVNVTLALVEAMGAALDATTASDAQGFFGGCGYRALALSLRRVL